MSEEERTANWGRPPKALQGSPVRGTVRLKIRLCRGCFWGLMEGVQTGVKGGTPEGFSGKVARAVGIRGGQDLVGGSGEMASPVWGVWGGAAGTLRRPKAGEGWDRWDGAWRRLCAGCSFCLEEHFL